MKKGFIKRLPLSTEPVSSRHRGKVVSAARTVLRVRDLTLRRGEATLLEGVSWQVDRGQHWALIGPNGCGKTSLLRTLTGYLSASSGEICLLGRTYGQSDWRDLRRQVGLVTSALQQSIPPAEPAVETVISGKYAQLDLWAKVTPEDLKEGRQWLRRVGLAGLEQREWLYLSQGERQRVLIARALIARPRLLILDEPCSGLDPVARDHFLRFLDQLARRGRSPALVLVTHHVEEIVPAITHALLLRAGRVVHAGAKKDVLTSAHLGRTFGVPLQLSSRHGRLALRIVRSPSPAPM